VFVNNSGLNQKGPAVHLAPGSVLFQKILVLLKAFGPESLENEIYVLFCCFKLIDL